MNVQLTERNFNLFDADRDHSFEGIMHSHGHNSSETQMKTTVFVMRHYVSEKLGKMNLRIGALIGMGALINKNKYKGVRLFERGHLLERGC